jgi:hypothetical protein
MERGWIEGTTTGDWEQLVASAVQDRIDQLAGNPDLEPVRALAKGRSTSRY